MNIFVLPDVLDPYEPISAPKTSYLSIVPIPRSHVIVRGRFISHLKLRPDPIVTTIIDSYLHHHRLSQVHLWWRSRLVSWLQVVVIGWTETKHSLRYLSHKTPIQTQPLFVIVCSITQQPLHRFTPFLFVNIALVRARPWLCSWSLTSPPSPRYLSHKVP